MPDPLRLIRPTKNSCNVVFAPDQGTGVLIAREFLEYPVKGVLLKDNLVGSKESKCQGGIYLEARNYLDQVFLLLKEAA